MNNRIIRLSELRDAVNKAYEEYRSIDSGSVDQRVKDADPDNFAISVALTDGTVFNKGDAQVRFPMGQISRIPVTSLLIEQKAALRSDDGGECTECNCKDKSKEFNS